MNIYINSCLFLGITQLASATVISITVDNFNDGFNTIEDSGSNVLTSTNSSYYVGVMNEASIGSATSVTDLFSNFTQMGEVVDGSGLNPTVSPGFFTGDATGDILALDGLGVYVFIMNAATAGSATEAFIWKHATETFNDTGSPLTSGPVIFNMTSANGASIFGGAAAGDDPYSTMLVTPVPEPTSIALLGLGSVALLLRRRR